MLQSYFEQFSSISLLELGLDLYRGASEGPFTGKPIGQLFIILNVPKVSVFSSFCAHGVCPAIGSAF